MNINNNYIGCLKDPPKVALAFKEIFMILLNLKNMLFCFKKKDKTARCSYSDCNVSVEGKVLREMAILLKV